MERLFIDIETYSDLSLKNCGVYKYVQSKEFTIMLFAYSVDGGSVIVIDLMNGESIPSEIISAIKDSKVTKWAFNAQFERVCLSKFLDCELPIESFKCSMILAAEHGLPLKLEAVGKALNLEVQKMEVGEKLVKEFCSPCKPTKANGYSTRKLPENDPINWALFKEYNKRDVETEMAIHNRLDESLVIDSEWEAYWLDQRINSRGVFIDEKVVNSAITLNQIDTDEALSTARSITGLDNPNSRIQLLTWFNENNVDITNLDKDTVKYYMNHTTGRAHEMLKLRQRLSKSSVKKYEAMLNCECGDGRIRGLFQFYGGHTGRFAGRLVQLQNLPRNSMSDLDCARNWVKQEEFDAMYMLYDSIPDVLSQLVRTALIPKPGCRFYIADFAAIEARVLAWYAGEEWRLKSFEAGEDIYCASASQMFGVPVVKHGVNGELRAKGKIAELALGYGGSDGALKGMGALDQGLKEEELQPLVTAWRNSNSNITTFWWSVGNAAMKAIKNKTTVVRGNLVFEYQAGYLFIKLPSGRKIAYYEPTIGINRFGSETIFYKGINDKKKWGDIDTYGPKLVENIVQATARDILIEAMERLENLGYEIVMHIHDEAVVEAPPTTSLETICEVMAETPKWADDKLLLRADGFVSDYYMKD